MKITINGEEYVKKEDKGEKVFESEDRKIIVEKDGTINIMDKITKDKICIFESLPLLYEAVELSKKIRGIK